MIMKYIILIDDRDAIVARYNEDDGSEVDDKWAFTPELGEQVWLPNHGLYEVQRLRYMCVDEPYLEVKMSFIKRNL